MSKLWLEDVLEIQGAKLLSALVEANEFTALPAISSTLSQFDFEGYYSILFKLKEVPFSERMELARNDDTNDDYSCMMDTIYERRSMNDLTDDEEEEIKEEWLKDRQIPKYSISATIFTDRDDIKDLPFTGFDFTDLIKVIREHFLFNLGNITFINPKGVIATYPIIE